MNCFRRNRILHLQVPASEGQMNVTEIKNKCNESNPIDPGELQLTKHNVANRAGYAGRDISYI
jgi:hypothetical protein